MIWIGIDCGTHTGLAVWDGDLQTFTRIETVKLHQALTFVLHTHLTEPGGVSVVFEDARQRKWIPASATSTSTAASSWEPAQ